MPLFALRDLDLAFGGPKLLDGAFLTIEPYERVSLIGRNGEGKSSLMKVITGQLKPDRVVFERKPGLKISMMEQEVPEKADGTVFDVCIQGLGTLATALRDYHHESQKLSEPEADTYAILARMEELQNTLELSGGWVLEQRVESILSRLKLNPEAPFESLSGGQKRRVLLARALVSEPDLLLLDEPTNHLDVESIQWIEEFLKRLNCALLFVTHDRAFLRSLATRIIELDRGRLMSYDCDYDTYLVRKEQLMEAEAKQNELFDRKLAQEEVWIRQGVKARRTRNEGRVRALKDMRKERSLRRDVKEGPTFEVQTGGLSGRKVIFAENVSFSWQGRPLIKDLSTVVMRGDKVGIIGPNGSGKTTMIRLMLGQLAPDSGILKLGTNLQVAYFDQLRAQLNPEKTVAWNVAGDNEFVMFGSSKRHIYSYLQDFLFPPDRARSPVKMLSGGERNRLLLARLFSREANLFVLDEPTNDLDLESLELLETLLVDLDATLLIVSHDREFLNRVATCTLAIEPDGHVEETVGGYEDYERKRKIHPLADTSREKKPAGRNLPAPAPVPAPVSRTLSQKEQKELDELPPKIEALEAQVASFAALMSHPNYGRAGGPDARKTKAEHDAVQSQLEKLYARWTELESLPRRR